MYGFIKGVAEEVEGDAVYVNAGGVGYELHVSTQTLGQVKMGEKVKLYTRLWVREDALILYGFYDKVERDMYDRLITVSGVGPRVALAILSGMTADAVAMAVLADDVAAFSKVPGIGKKIAQRLILELRGKLEKADFSIGSFSPAQAPAGSAAQEALAALVALGYTASEAAQAVGAAASESTVEDIVRLALRQLDQR